MTFNQDDRQAVIDMLMLRFVGEECRICGRPIEQEDLAAPNRLMFAGKVKEPGKRVAHGRCWEGMFETLLDAPAEVLAQLQDRAVKKLTGRAL